MDEEEFEGIEPLPIPDAHPSAIFSEGDGMEESDVVFEWVHKAQDLGVLTDDSSVTVDSLNGILRVARDNHMIPSEWSVRDALILLTYWTGYAGGIEFEKRRNNLRAAAMMGAVSAKILGQHMDFDSFLPDDDDDE